MVDDLQLYFGHPHIIDYEGVDGVISIIPPKLGEIINFGYHEFYSTLNVFIANSTMFRSFLWDINLDWNDVSDYQLFCMLYKTINDEASNLIIPNIKFSNFEVYLAKLEDGTEKEILYSIEDKIEINEDVYKEISQCIKHIFRMYPEDEFTSDPLLKKWWIDKDKRENKRRKDKPSEFSILPMISSYVNHPGTKYKLSELEEVNVCEFFDSIERLQIYEQSTALLKGMMGGFIDSSKISSEEYNFMRSGNKDKNKKKTQETVNS